MRVYGKNVVKELLQKPKSIKKAYIYENFNDIKLLNEIKKLNIPIKYLDKKSLDNMEDGNHQGIILEIDDYNYSPLDKLLKKDIIVILDHLEDPHNFGAIIRTCEAAGITSIIIPKDTDIPWGMSSILSNSLANICSDPLSGLPVPYKLVI